MDDLVGVVDRAGGGAVVDDGADVVTGAVIAMRPTLTRRGR
jgi:hypothetical protein